jgi:hypothetical protein
MNQKAITALEANQINDKLVKHGLKTKVKSGDKNTDYLDKVMKEINKHFGFSQVDDLTKRRQ